MEGLISSVRKNSRKQANFGFIKIYIFWSFSFNLSAEGKGRSEWDEEDFPIEPVESVTKLANKAHTTAREGNASSMESWTQRFKQREAPPCLLALSQVNLYHICWWVLNAAITQAPEEVALTAHKTSQQTIRLWSLNCDFLLNWDYWFSSC